MNLQARVYRAHKGQSAGTPAGAALAGDKAKDKGKKNENENEYLALFAELTGYPLDQSESWEDQQRRELDVMRQSLEGGLTYRALRRGLLAGLIDGDAPLLGQLAPAGGLPSLYAVRFRLVEHYSWAIPSEEALACLLRYSPLVEIGAGSGYWAHLAQARGARINPYDKAQDTYLGTACRILRHWTPVAQGTEFSVVHHPHDTLFLCWPPLGDDMAARALARTQAQHCIYVGEPAGGATASSRFFRMLDRDWTLREHIRLPQWIGIRDSLFVYKRTKTAKTAKSTKSLSS